MGNLMGSLFGTEADKPADPTMAFNAMSAAAAASSAYLIATLEATTPEVRRLFSEYTTQSVMAHEVLTALCIKKGWVNPYDTPVKQLQTSVNESQSVIGNAPQ